MTWSLSVRVCDEIITTMASIGYEDLDADINEVKEGFKDLKRDINVLFVGASGVGKSSLINSMIMAFNTKQKRCREYASKGSGAGQQTATLHCYDIKQLLKLEEYKFSVKFWDFPGFPDSRDDITAIIASLVLDGCLVDGASYEGLKAMGKNKLLEMTKKQDKNNQIDIVCYVHSAKDFYKENLVKNLKELTQSDKRELPILLVITKMDLTSEKDISTILGKCKESLLLDLGLAGCQEKVAQITNYCFHTAEKMKRNEELDKKLIDLWYRIVVGLHIRERPDTSYLFTNRMQEGNYSCIIL